MAEENWTQKELAAHLRIGITCINKFLRERRSVPLRTLKKFESWLQSSESLREALSKRKLEEDALAVSEGSGRTPAPAAKFSRPPALASGAGAEKVRLLLRR